MIGKNQILNSTVMADKGQLIYCPSDKPEVANLRCVGTVATDWQHLFAAAPIMFKTLDNTSKGMENLLTIAESEGFDKVAGNLQELIAVLKIVQRVALYGSNELTGQSLPNK